MLSALGNFSIQASASASDLGLSPLKTMMTPCASFMIPGHTLSFLMLPEWLLGYLRRPRIRWRLVGYRLLFNVLLF